MLQRRASPPPAPPVELDEARVARLGALLVERGPGDSAARIARAERVCAGRFEFLNQEVELGQPDWRARPVSHLWSYNLHYFEYALDLAWASRLAPGSGYGDRLAELVSGWIAATADGTGDGWEPYPLSVRLLSWIWVLALLPDGFDPAVRAEMVRSMARQLAFLERRLEWHLLGNHLLKNLCALAAGGMLFRGAVAERWAEQGRRALWAQVEEQVLDDGVHFERSPMYHAIALGDLLDVLLVADAAGRETPAPVVARIQRMRVAMRRLSRPDGSLHLVNDSAEGIAPHPGELERDASRLLGPAGDAPDGIWHLREAGFAGFASPGERLLVDCGAPGPAYQPGHAHCGLLGYELDLEGSPAVVDSGVHGYDGDLFREYVRSTRAHSTVLIGGREQSEVWGTFRLARRARLAHASVSGPADAPRIEAGYRPYHLPGAMHRRVFSRIEGGWEVVDTVTGADGASLESWVHLAPDLAARWEDGRVVASGPRGVVVIEPPAGAVVTLHRGEREPVQGWYCPEFGRALPATAVRFAIESNSGRPFGYRIRTL